MSRRRAIGLALAAASVIAACLPAKAHGGWSAVTTYYDLQGQMANGDWVHPGAAACPKAYLGATVHVIEPDVWVICEDTGAPAYFEAGYFRLDVWASSRPWWLTDSQYDVEVYWF